MSADGSGLFYVTVHVTADESQVYRIEAKSEDDASELAAMDDAKCFITEDGSSLYHGLRIYGCDKVE